MPFCLIFNLKINIEERYFNQYARWKNWNSCLHLFFSSNNSIFRALRRTAISKKLTSFPIGESRFSCRFWYLETNQLSNKNLLKWTKHILDKIVKWKHHNRLIKFSIGKINNKIKEPSSMKEWIIATTKYKNSGYYANIELTYFQKCFFIQLKREYEELNEFSWMSRKAKSNQWEL